MHERSSRFLNSRRSSHKLKPACSVVVAIDKYHTCSIRKPGLVDSQMIGTAYVTRRAAELNSTGVVLPKPWNTLEQAKIRPCATRFRETSRRNNAATAMVSGSLAKPPSNSWASIAQIS